MAAALDKLGKTETVRVLRCRPRLCQSVGQELQRGRGRSRVEADHGVLRALPQVDPCARLSDPASFAWRSWMPVIPRRPRRRPPAPGFAMVAPGIISTDLPEFALTISADGNEMYFNRASADRAKLIIMMSHSVPEVQWKTPVVAPFSGTWRDVDPFLAPDGQRLYFSSNRPRTVRASRRSAPGTWSVARRAGAIRSIRAHPSTPIHQTCSCRCRAMASCISPPRAMDHRPSTSAGMQAAHGPCLFELSWARQRLARGTR